MIKVENLSKEFGAKVAVDDVSFTVERGEILGFLGPNGAGKSTTMRMITGYIPPTAGVAIVGNHDIIENPIEAKRLIGYLPESAPLYTDMTVEGFLGFCAEVRGINGTDKAKAIDRAIEMCFLEQVRHQSVDTLSKGYRHRTCFAQSIIHDPDILVMDEPTDGLDPNQKHEMRMLIRRMGQSKAIIFSTHILEEVEAACTRAIIIDQGKVVANGTPDELKNKSELETDIVSGLEHVRFKKSQIPIQDLNSLLSFPLDASKGLVEKIILLSLSDKAIAISYSGNFIYDEFVFEQPDKLIANLPLVSGTTVDDDQNIIFRLNVENLFNFDTSET